MHSYAIKTPASEPLANEKTPTSSSAGLLCGGFALTGMVGTLLGPILPFLTARWQLDDAHAGLLFTAQFAGSMAGVLLSSEFLTRGGFRVSLVTGFGAMGLGVATLGFGSSVMGLISVLCYGVGLGLTIPTANLLVAESNPHRRAAALNILNLGWGVGAFCFPLIVTAFLRIRHISAIPLLLGAAAIVFALIFAATVPGAAGRRTVRAAGSTRQRFPVQLRTLVILALLFFLYVGTEAAVAGWIATFGRRVHAGTGTYWVLIPSFFWGAMLVGRALAPLYLRHARDISVARAGLVLATVGTCVVLIAAGLPALAAGAALAGFGLAAVFPITIAELSRRFAGSASRFAGGMFALGGLGGATLPWVVGYVSNRTGSLRAGLWVPVVGCVALLALYLARWENEEREPRQSN